MVNYSKEREKLVNYLISLGVLKSEKVINAFLKVPREIFVPKKYKSKAYYDIALPSLKGQTISQPSTIALMLEYLQLENVEKVLEIGSGTGYVLALLSFIVKKVYGIERIKELVEFSRNKLKELKIKNVKVFWKDGKEGLNEYSPYDRILVSCASPKIYQSWIDQLKDKGILVLPLGEYFQKITIVKKTKEKIEIERREEVLFVPLRDGLEG